jgi:hypothetical protein
MRRSQALVEHLVKKGVPKLEMTWEDASSDDASLYRLFD